MNVLFNNNQIQHLANFLKTLKYQQFSYLRNYIEEVNDHFEDAGINDSFIHINIQNDRVYVNGFLGTGGYCLDDPDYADRLIKFEVINEAN